MVEADPLMTNTATFGLISNVPYDFGGAAT